ASADAEDLLRRRTSDSSEVGSSGSKVFLDVDRIRGESDGAATGVAILGDVVGIGAAS
ncbi:hypothetical protein NDU88_000734, partial [Pleurodeles waltl]